MNDLDGIKVTQQSYAEKQGKGFASYRGRVRAHLSGRTRNTPLIRDKCFLHFGENHCHAPDPIYFFILKVWM